MPGYSWDPYSGDLLPKCCDDACSLAYDPGSGEQFVATCETVILPGYVPNPGQCVCSDVVPPPLPPAPDSLNVIQGGAGFNFLLWSPNGLGDAFNVYRGTTPGGPYTFVADAGGGLTGSYGDGTAVQGVTYYYVVTKVVDGVESLPSNEASITTQTDWDVVVAQLLTYNPDLIIAAEGLPGVLGTPITSIVNRGLAGGNMVAVLGSEPTLVPAGLNGHPTMRFDGVGQYLQMPLAGLTGVAGITVFKRGGVNTNQRIATVLSGSQGSDAGATTPVIHYLNSDSLASYYNGGTPPTIPIADTNFHSAISYLDGAGNAFLRLDAGAYVTSGGCTETADPATYAAIGAPAPVTLLGEVACHLRWKTAPTPTTLNNAWIQLRNYYGL